MINRGLLEELAERVKTPAENYQESAVLFSVRIGNEFL